MKKTLTLLVTTTLLSTTIATTALAANTTTKDQTQNAMDKEVYSASEEVTATVESINYDSRKISLKLDDGEVLSFTADEDIKNFNQLKKGDTVTTTYKEALVYNINKGGQATGPKVTNTVKTARPGSKPGASVDRELTTTVIISAIDEKTPSVTFKNAAGEKTTFKVRHPERLKEVKVGDAVDLTYREAIAIKINKKTSKQ